MFQILGPGLITGASDDDPSGIATYSQVGAQFGFGLGWIMLFSFPLMTAIQETSARIGRATGEGIAGNIRRHYPLWLLRIIVGLLLIANIINLGADLGAMGSVVTHARRRAGAALCRVLRRALRRPADFHELPALRQHPQMDHASACSLMWRRRW